MGGCWGALYSTPNAQAGIPEELIGQPDYGGDGQHRAFDPIERSGGRNTTGVVVDSGVLNPELLKGRKGCRIYPKLTVRERADSIITHEYEEITGWRRSRASMKAAAKTTLAILPKRRKLNRAMAR